MLNVTITGTAIYFKDLTDELQQVISKYYDLEYNEKKRAFYISDKPEKLYKILVKLSYDYDIEVV